MITDRPKSELAIDPITVEVIRNAFNSIAQQMNNNLARSAYTPIIYEMKDCSVAVFDQDVRQVGQSTGLPVFVGTLETAVRSIVDHFGIDTLRPGDVYLVSRSPVRLMRWRMLPHVRQP